MHPFNLGRGGEEPPLDLPLLSNKF